MTFFEVSTSANISTLWRSQHLRSAELSPAQKITVASISCFIIEPGRLPLLHSKLLCCSCFDCESKIGSSPLRKWRSTGLNIVVLWIMGRLTTLSVAVMRNYTCGEPQLEKKSNSNIVRVCVCVCVRGRRPKKKNTSVFSSTSLRLPEKGRGRWREKKRVRKDYFSSGCHPNWRVGAATSTFNE